MTISTAAEARTELEKVVKYSRDDAMKAIAAGVLVLLNDVKNIGNRVMNIEKRLSK